MPDNNKLSQEPTARWKSQDSEVRSQRSGFMDSGVRIQDSGVRSKESGDRSQDYMEEVRENRWIKIGSTEETIIIYLLTVKKTRGEEILITLQE